MLSLGPVPMSLVALLMALACAAGAALFLRRVKPGQPPVAVMSQVFDMLLVGAVTARFGYVLAWLPQYLADPWSIIWIGDGGFLVWAGVLGGLGFGAWRTRKAPSQRRPIFAAAAVGLGTWAVLSTGLVLLQRETLAIPTSELSTLEGTSVHLSELAGKPLVVNLWATWCPPCRREMPVLATAQARRSDVTFAFVNQGEAAQTIREYLHRSKLDLRNVLLDPASSVGQEIRSRGLPATLFFDVSGRLVDTHFGPLSTASLADKMASLGVGPEPSRPDHGGP